MVQSIVDAFNQSHVAVMSNPQFADTFGKLIQGQELSVAEQVQQDSAVNHLFNIYTSIQRAFDGGQIDREYFDTCCMDVIRACEQTPGWDDAMNRLIAYYPNEARLEIFAGLPSRVSDS